MLTLDKIPALMQEVHFKANVDSKFVLAIAGGGSGAVHYIYEGGGGTNTVLGAHILQDQQMSAKYAGVVPERYLSDVFARQLAVAAYEEACKLNPNAENVFGIGSTSSLKKVGPEPEREGREHIAYVSVHGKNQTKLVTLVFDKEAKRSRSLEEHIVSLVILNEIVNRRVHAPSFYLEEMLKNYLSDKDFLVNQWGYGVAEVIPPHTDGYIWRNNGYDRKIMPNDSYAILSTSANPLHEGHKTMRELAEKKLGIPVVFEMSVKNTDKPTLDFIEIEKRVDQFKAARLPLIVTHTSRFIEKAKLLPPNRTFVMGYDTFARLVDAKYYGKHFRDAHEQVEAFTELGTKFLVFCRVIDNKVQTLKDLPAHPLMGLATEISPNEFCMSISSTQIRKAQHAL